jgi:hypothetical protein
VGFLSRRKQGPIAPPPPPTTTSYEPRRPNASLGPFGAYDFKSQFMIDWAADVFREAGKDPSAHASGVEDMAMIAAFTQIVFRLRSAAVNNNDEKSCQYLDSFDRENLLQVLDTLYPTAIRSIAKGAGCRDGAMVDHFVGDFNGTFDRIFTACRAEFVQGVLKGDF